jgi:uncharacterized membrane protein YjgN (DUF898 family)
VRCPKCATSLADDSWICSRCGFPVRPLHHEVRLEFEGNALQVLAWLLLAALVSVRVTLPPAIRLSHVRVDFTPPWVTGASTSGLMVAWLLSIVLAIAGVWLFEAACRWFCRNLRFSDGTTADFSGRGAEVRPWWAIWVLAGRRRGLGGIPEDLLQLALYFLGLWATLNVFGWFVAHVELSSGRRFCFTGAYAELLGWQVMLALSVVTLIGWAWILAAMFRWMARSSGNRDEALQFHGLGHQILWRTLVAMLLCIPLVTIPFAWLWYMRWLVQNTTIVGQVGDPVV